MKKEQIRNNLVLIVLNSILIGSTIKQLLVGGFHILPFALLVFGTALTLRYTNTIIDQFEK